MTLYMNGKKVHESTFPNGEINIMPDENLWVLEEEKAEITWQYSGNGAEDLLAVRLLVNSIREHNKKHNSINLTVLYMPYSRMDRLQGNQPFSLLEYFKMFPQVDKLEIVEPHSDVTGSIARKLIDSGTYYSERFATVEMLPEVLAEELSNTWWEPVLVYPDKGAKDRYDKLATDSDYSFRRATENRRVLFGNKVRDFDTGRIKSLELVGEPPTRKGWTAIIVDDLTSYGGTFVKTATEAIKLGASRVVLLVAHMEGSATKGELFESIDKVYTTNSMEASYTPEELKEVERYKKLGLLDVTNIIK
ncbi:hypothetical protein [Listeria phage P100plus]|uniref:ribose-phosphate diphosphokinase n=6 Tax=Pecentumvirus TaxID=1857844 RepID=A0A6H2A869_9CAUD|nr:ribose-phosphate pyrophosphokinase [Listeria phage LP-083-2]YP_009784579.1 ribose-phosphate pyrophosphokinase [Listeria phage LP-124]YP_406439.1 ribose-phosphate pyrophosphokinase [Listeria phage P100]QDK04978.2 ribose-phosphate pyrophosphokinase [Listeria phage LP-066]QJB22319.1 hypothetical protein [Listeria phage P100plus]QJB22509.1 hypothetical protein [Listeria phage P200]AAY53366.1 gp63 [Listeria phage P100]AHL19353.1 ribose-phosphate pyrophosphokinase [Listeria phage LP-083-2]